MGHGSEGQRSPIKPTARTFAVLPVVLALVSAAPAAASGADRHAAMVIDANTGAVLHADTADAPRYPASLTKMMTLYLVFEAIEQRRLSYATPIKISEEAAGTQPSKLHLAAGSEIALIHAIKALIVKSANDIAVAIAEHMAGSEEKFAELMTATARRIGMTNTTFKNVSGLPDTDQVTTARDMVTLALRLHDQFPRHTPLFATRTFNYGGHTYRNHNGLLGNYAGTDGIKTGYTRLSGFNIVSSVRRGQKHVIGAVFGAVSAGSRNAAMRQLLTFALLKASATKTRKPSPVLIALPRLAPRPASTAAAETRGAPRSDPASTAGREATAVRSGEGAEAPPPRPPIVIAHVRPVMIAPRMSPPAAAATTGPLQTSASPVTEATSETRAQTAPAVSADNVVWGTSEVPPSAPKPAAAAAVAAPVPPIRTVTPPAYHTAITPAPESAARGAPPSTLQQQAESLARAAGPHSAPANGLRERPAIKETEPTPARHPQAPAPAGGAAAGGFQVQVGAFSTAGEAERVLAAVRERSQGLLAGYRPLTLAVTLTVQKESRQLFRARFAGFDQRTAADTCLELRRRRIDCLVAKAE